MEHFVIEKPIRSNLADHAVDLHQTKPSSMESDKLRNGSTTGHCSRLLHGDAAIRKEPFSDCCNDCFLTSSVAAIKHVCHGCFAVHITGSWWQSSTPVWLSLGHGVVASKRSPYWKSVCERSSVDCDCSHNGQKCQAPLATRYWCECGAGGFSPRGHSQLGPNSWRWDLQEHTNSLGSTLGCRCVTAVFVVENASTRV